MSIWLFEPALLCVESYMPKVVFERQNGEFDEADHTSGAEVDAG